MAERRMFAKTIIDSDAFLDMPQSTQLLYFQIAMRADDDGFINNPKSIMRNVGCKEDDLKLLAAKKFILPFESGVVVIKHWKIHNYIQKDRYTETKYKDEKLMLSLDENNSYTLEVGDYTSRQETMPLSSARIRRIEAKKNSSLPYSFEYKIRGAFVGEICPICGVTMDYSNNLTKPTIQHNTPISMGGVHEIENISVICQSCNTSIQNKTITEKLNTEKVRKVWECIGNVSGMDTQVRLELGKDRLGNTQECAREEIPKPKEPEQPRPDFNPALHPEIKAPVINWPDLYTAWMKTPGTADPGVFRFCQITARKLIPLFSGLTSEQVFKAVENFQDMLSRPTWWTTTPSIVTWAEKHIDRFLPGNYNPEEYRKEETAQEANARYVKEAMEKLNATNG
jgi:hypothetical protein